MHKTAQSSGPAVQYSHDCTAYTQSRSTNSWNQVANVVDSGSSITTTYDAKGNLTAYGNMTFTHDAFNRLITAGGTGPDGQSFAASYAYDALGRRVEKTGVNSAPRALARWLAWKAAGAKPDGSAAAGFRGRCAGSHTPCIRRNPTTND